MNRQVDAKDVILDEEFNTLIKAKVSEIMPILMGESCTDNDLVDLELYKLVYYEKDGHFLSHRDTEKAPGMFATLVVQLPAGHYGGALVIRHKGETKVHPQAVVQIHHVLLARHVGERSRSHQADGATHQVLHALSSVHLELRGHEMKISAFFF